MPKPYHTPKSVRESVRAELDMAEQVMEIESEPGCDCNSPTCRISDSHARYLASVDSVDRAHALAKVSGVQFTELCYCGVTPWNCNAELFSDCS